MIYLNRGKWYITEIDKTSRLIQFYAERISQRVSYSDRV